MSKKSDHLVQKSMTLGALKVLAEAIRSDRNRRLEGLQPNPVNSSYTIVDITEEVIGGALTITGAKLPQRSEKRNS